ncbi:MAG: hypothetical protein ACWA44_12580 [Thiotrichales bacterium]
MSYFHIHLSVDCLSESVDFYNHLFGQDPAIERPGYAKWQLDDPQVNFSISAKGARAGLDHLGFQAADASELALLRKRAEAAAGEAVIDQEEASCCYARSDKHWTIDPAGIAWEHFHSMGQLTRYFGSDRTDTKSDTKRAHRFRDCCGRANGDDGA